MRTPIPIKNLDLTCSDKINLVADLMAASVVPLFYAANQNEALLSAFLKKHARTCQENEKQIDHYLSTLEAFYVLLPTFLEKRLASYTVESEKLLKRINNKFGVYQQACKKHEPLLKRLKEDRDGEFTPDQCLVIKTLHKIVSDIERLSKKRQKLESKIKDFTQTPSQTSTHEITHFIKEVMRFSQNFADGTKNLPYYFQDREEIVHFLLEKRDVFNNIAEAWIQYVLDLNLPIKNHPLPMYLCPFDASEEAFNHEVQYKITKVIKVDRILETTYKRVDNPYTEHLACAKSHGLLLLVKRMLKIQTHFPGHQKTMTREYIRLTLPLRRLTAKMQGLPTIVSQQTFFQPKVILRRTSDDSRSSESTEDSSGRSTNANRMFNSIITTLHETPNQQPLAASAQSNIFPAKALEPQCSL